MGIPIGTSAISNRPPFRHCLEEIKFALKWCRSVGAHLRSLRQSRLMWSPIAASR
jgi:hypothetical protein